jgi:serine/threonine protein kinase/tetratricopeptide (TPR) repeat protein
MTEQEVFEAARAIPDAAGRAAYLDRACAADPALREWVEDRLLADPEVGGFLEEADDAEETTGPVAPGRWVDPAALLPLGEGPGSRIGPYKLLQLLGEGGMGAVFLAEQQEPVKRRVALKVVKAGMDSARVVARFEAERQALALMDHPHIAKVLDAGTTESGRPYFVMELVKGIPINRFCDQEHLTPRERLGLFVLVCQAVQHAHQKGIIHRDLKPSNVLIALYDGKPVPKVIDFGVAKATAQTLTERTVFTEVGQVVGTLEYMAPEQAELNNLDIDTRADVYSLGVLLYELLTGSLPFSAKELRGAAFTEMLRMIRETEPRRPSTRLLSSPELPAIAANRGLEPAKLARLVRGDLDWIVMKCLEKERGRRYETANGLALDVERYLADEPVLASPPGVRYRLGKFVRRYRGPVLAAAVILALLVAGIVGTSLGFLRAERLRTAAEENRQAALAAAGAEREAKQKAEASQKRAMEALRATTDDVVEQLIGARPDLGPAERAFLENTLKRWQACAAEHGDGELARAVRAEGVFRVAFLRAMLGEQEEALAGYREATALWQQLVADFAAVPEYREHLAANHHHLGNLLRDLGKLSEAEAAYGQALALLELLAAEFPARPQYRRRLAAGYGNLGALLTNRGRGAEAEAAYRRALALQKKLAADFPARPEYREHLARSYDYLGVLLLDLHKPAEAEAALREGLAIRAKLVADPAAVPRYRIDLGGTQLNLGHLFRATKQGEQALEWYGKAVTTLEGVLRQIQFDTTAQAYLLGAHLGRAITLQALKRHAEAAADWDRAAELSPEPRRAAVRMARALCRARAGQWEAATREAEELAQNADAARLFDAACVFALAAARPQEAGGPPSREECGRRAVALLRQAVAGGSKGAEDLKTEEALKGLRGRDDFKKLLAELETKSP